MKVKNTLLFAFLLACSKTPPTPAPAATPPAATTGEIELKSPTFTILKDGVAGIAITEEGVITMQGEPVGRLAKSHGIVDMNGKLLASIGEGQVLDGSGNPLVQLDGKGTLNNGSGVPISWSDEGHLLMGTEDSGFTVEPNDPDVYQAASMVLFLWLSVGSSEIETLDAVQPTEDQGPDAE